MPSILIVDKSGNIKEQNVKELVEADLLDENSLL
jgi:hypothetical protein